MVGNCEAGYSCLYQNTISWRTPTTPLPMETHPRVVFQRLFGDGGTPAQQRRQLETSGSILDAVTERLGQLSKKLGPGDRARLEQYTESVREIETRIDKAEKRTADSSVEVPDRPSDIPSGFAEHVKLMFDLQAAAFQADITRVIAFQLARELSPRTYPQIGVNGQHHATSHHGNAAGKINDVAKIDAYHLELVSYYLGKLRSIKEGDGNLLDNSITLLGGGLGNPNEHAVIDLPNLVFGGGGGRIKGNRHLAYKIENYTPETNLVISLLDRAGVPIEKLGDSTGQLKEIDV